MMVFFDLDGPLLDVSLRYQLLHRDLVEAMGGTPMPADSYWARKRSRCSEASILEEIGASALERTYSRRRLELIETDNYLQHDRPWPWTHSVLETLATSCPLI